MPVIYPIQQSFSSGELSPLVNSRSDLEIYRAGCSFMENFIPSQYGPAIKRSGSALTETIASAGKGGKLFPFNVSSTSSYMIVAANKNIHICDKSGVVLSTNLLQNNSFDDGSLHWEYADPGPDGVYGRVEFFPGYARLTSGNLINFPYLKANESYVSQQVTIDVDAINDVHVLRYTCMESGSSSNSILRIGTTVNSHDIDSVIADSAQGNFSFTPGVSTFWVTFAVRSYNIERNLTSMTLSLGSALSDTISFASPWSDEELRQVQIATAPDSSIIVFTHPKYSPRKLELTGAGAWIFEPIVFTSPPASWTGNNWPSVVEFFQGRMWLMSTPARPETMWASRSDNFFDFTMGVVADAAQEFTISNRGQIRWAVSTKNFLIGTENGEFIITSQGGVVWAEDFGIEQQSSYGSKSHQPVKIGNEVIFIAPNSESVRQINYEFAADGWISKEVSFASNHITSNKLKDICFAQHPSNTMWFTDEAGHAISCVYDKSSGTVGWSRHVTQGKILSMAVTEEFGTTVVWGLVDRGVPNILFLERFYPSGNQYFLDCHINLVYEEETVTVTGLDDLNGFTVSVVVDGAVHPGVQVVNGTIELIFSGKNITVGLPYSSKLKTLRPDVNVGPMAQSSFMFNASWSEVYVYLIDSYMPKIQGQRPPVRNPSTLMGIAEPAMTGHIKIQSLGHNDGTIEIEQDLPLSCAIGAIYGTMEVNKI